MPGLHLRWLGMDLHHRKLKPGGPNLFTRLGACPHAVDVRAGTAGWNVDRQRLLGSDCRPPRRRLCPYLCSGRSCLRTGRDSVSLTARRTGTRGYNGAAAVDFRTMMKHEINVTEET